MPLRSCTTVCRHSSAFFFCRESLEVSSGCQRTQCPPKCRQEGRRPRACTAASRLLTRPRSQSIPGDGSWRQESTTVQTVVSQAGVGF